ncbi:MAG: NAD(+) synthase, partial [Clostridia bacterium]|nr:NAD(+) synthase [Clostridia bacterium]
MPERILEKAPNDGLGGQTDEEKMGVTYKQIEEMIETGDTEEKAKQKILEKYRASMHKRKPIPKYAFDRV